MQAKTGQVALSKATDYPAISAFTTEVQLVLGGPTLTLSLFGPSGVSYLLAKVTHGRALASLGHAVWR